MNVNLDDIQTGHFVKLSDEFGNLASGRVTRYRQHERRWLSVWCFRSELEFAGNYANDVMSLYPGVTLLEYRVK